MMGRPLSNTVDDKDKPLEVLIHSAGNSAVIDRFFCKLSRKPLLVAEIIKVWNREHKIYDF
jgi:hypothetical protein